jgi:hypothetical protein
MVAWVVVATSLYGLGWTRLFGPLRGDTALFLSFVGLLFLVLATAVPTTRSADPAAPVRAVTVFAITAYYFVAYAASGGVPLLLVMSGGAYDIYGFGIEGLHIFALCLTGYYAVRLFRAAITRGGKWVWIGWIWLTLLVTSIGNRSALSFLVFACAFLLLRRYKLNAASMVFALAFAIAFMLFFGGFGDVRLSFQIEQATSQQGSSSAILNLSGATQRFSETGLPPSSLWLYMYFVSPVANLNQAFAYAGGGLCGQSCDLAGLLVHGFVPDAVGQRFAELFSVPRFDKSAFLIAPNLTASTLFGSAVGYAGLLGGVLLLMWVAVVCILVMRLLAGTDVYEEGVAILATVVFFSFFENMIAYSALSLQLVLVLLRGRLRIRWL